MEDRTEYRAAVVAMAGAGQLAQITQAAAISLGIELRVLARSETESAVLACATALVGDDTAESLRELAEGAAWSSPSTTRTRSGNAPRLKAEGIHMAPSTVKWSRAVTSIPTRALAAGAPAILRSSMSTPMNQAIQPSLEAFAKDESRETADSEFLRKNKAPPPVVGPDFEIVDLFAGCGGLSIGAIEGARRAGRTAGLALAVDSDPDPLAVLQRSLSLPDRCFAVADLSDVLGSLGSNTTSGERSLFAGVSRGPLLLAGPPCQGHSALNNHTRHDDPRNDLYLAVGRVARILEPAAVIVENVRGIDRDRRSSVARCSSVLEELGYHVTTRRIDLSTLGVPQRRIRHLLVATLDCEFDWNLPLVEPRDIAWAIGDLMDLTGSRPFDSPSTPTAVNLKRMQWLIDNDEYNLPNELRPECHRSDHSYRSMYGRLRWDAPAQTITSGFGSMGQGRYVHPAQARTLTPHEAARLQFLPDFLEIGTVERRGALAQMIGNAAPPLLTTVLVQALDEQNLL